ncbi:MAG: NAD(P)H-binding protein [Kofleriaceae bacterium]|nr:NAD(P)H-binding protein [Kofleriaceae bacterium]
MTAPVAFVAGATGFVGRAVVPALVARGARVVAHVRPDSPQLAAWRERFGALGAEVDATPWAAAALTATLAALAPTHVFGLIGTTRKRARADGVAGDIYETVDLGLTRLLVEAAAAAGTRPRVVYLSSVGASATARSPYLRARARAEDAVRASGLPWVIARPSLIVEGEGDGRDDARPGERVAGVVADGLLAVAGALGARRLRARYRSTTPAVLAAALVDLALDQPAGTIASGDDLRPRRG